jgi:probable H4MPT-linked C1 transfer pathway protein
MQRRKKTVVSVIGFDIGGANTKAAFIITRDGCVENLATATEYFPVWKTPEKLATVLTRIAKQVSKANPINLIIVTMTAELSDAYNTKREGVNQILKQVIDAFPKTCILVLDVDAKLRTLQEAETEPWTVAAANWAATGWMISQLTKNCVVVDVGSTTTSIVPVVEGAVSAMGKSDLEKLVCGELVYTGSLRTNVAATVQTIPVRGHVTRVSSELFAQTADVHLILGNISEKDYTVETADGKEKTRNASLARLARVVCADIEMLSEQEIVGMAQFIYNQQVEQIAEALTQISSRMEKRGARNVQAIVTGFGRNFLARKAALKAGFSEVVDFAKLTDSNVARVSTAFAVALMGASQLEGRAVRWMR